MTAVIVEDEIPAGIRLERLLNQYEFQVLVVLNSVKKAIIWLKENKHPDIVFMDIKLRDGNCFEIFDKVKVESKIVFTTAFDEYALNAFNYNSIDYLLKPIDESLSDFFNFQPPFETIPTWIDHGYQPYNFSLYDNHQIDSSEFSLNLKKKNISILWNYIDSGTATIGVINQLNRADFTLNSYLKGIKDHALKDKFGMIINH